MSGVGCGLPRLLASYPPTWDGINALNPGVAGAKPPVGVYKHLPPFPHNPSYYQSHLTSRSLASTVPPSFFLDKYWGVPPAPQSSIAATKRRGEEQGDKEPEARMEPRPTHSQRNPRGSPSGNWQPPPEILFRLRRIGGSVIPVLYKCELILALALNSKLQCAAEPGPTSQSGEQSPEALDDPQRCVHRMLIH